MRPNQLYAISLGNDLVPRDRAQHILRLVKKQLVTPVGLRTLAPDDPRYRPRYEGSVLERDSAYHQGTVWPFLLGPLVTAWIKGFGRNAKSRTEAKRFLNGLESHLSEACLGQVSEIFDAEAPHYPRGCYAQAWSVAEPLRALVDDLGISVKMLQTPVKPSTIRQRQISTPPVATKPTRSTKAPKKPRTKARSTRRAT